MLESKLSFEEHLKSVLVKLNKTVDLTREFRLHLPRNDLLTIYKFLVRPQLDCGAVIHGEAYNELVIL